CTGVVMSSIISLSVFLQRVTFGGAESTLELRQRHLRNCKGLLAVRHGGLERAPTRADVAWTFYGAVGYLEESGEAASSPQDLGRHALIGWEETAVGIMAADWLNRTRRRLRLPDQQ